MLVQVEKYKKMRDGKYKVSFSNGKEMDLYEEVILKYELLLKKEIDTKKILGMIDYNQECDAYYAALKYLKTRLRSYKEVFDLLKKKEYPLTIITKVLDRLLEQGYLNDSQYASSFLHEQLLTTSRGPNKICYELTKKGISQDIILEVISSYSDEMELEKIRKIIHKMVKSNRNRSTLMLKRKIEQDLLQQGFHRHNIQTVMEEVSISSSEEIRKREYDKLYRKLSSKYSGEALEYQIKQKMYQKGFCYED